MGRRSTSCCGRRRRRRRRRARRRLEDTLAGEIELIQRELSSGECADPRVVAGGAEGVGPAVSLTSRGTASADGDCEKNSLRALPAIKTRLEQVRMPVARSMPSVGRSRRARAPGFRAFECSCATSCYGWMHVCVSLRQTICSSSKAGCLPLVWSTCRRASRTRLAPKSSCRP